MICTVCQDRHWIEVADLDSNSRVLDAERCPNCCGTQSANTMIPHLTLNGDGSWTENQISTEDAMKKMMSAIMRGGSGGVSRSLRSKGAKK